MAKTDERKASVKETGEEIPQEDWKRFEAAVDAAVKSGPKHRQPKAEARALKSGSRDRTKL